MTYLDLVNNVLRRLRETEVSSVQSNSYSKLIGDLVNDAKDLVETSWDWSALRTTLTITTTADVFNYSLTGSQNNIKELNVLNDTSNLIMQYQTNNWFDSQFLLGNPVSGAPMYYTYNGVDSDGDTLIDVYPKPDGVYSLRFNCALRNPDLSADTDTIKIPAMPVVAPCCSFCFTRTWGNRWYVYSEYFSMANKYLSDAIAMDAARHPEETIFYTP